MASANPPGACQGPCEVTIHDADRPPRRVIRALRPNTLDLRPTTDTQPGEADPLMGVGPPGPASRASIHLHLHRDGGDLAEVQGPAAGQEPPPPRPQSPGNKAPPLDPPDTEPYFRVSPLSKFCKWLLEYILISGVTLSDCLRRPRRHHRWPHLLCLQRCQEVRS